MNFNNEVSQTKLVLIIGVDIEIFEVLQAYLKRDGIRAEYAGSGLKVLPLFVELQPDVVLLDIYIQSSDSFEILKNIQSRSNTPIIIFTTLTDQENRQLSSRLGTEYISKPFDPSEVIYRIKSALNVGISVQT